VRKAKLIVAVAPSGGGKTYLCDCAREEFEVPRLRSATTRKKRKGEIEGVRYFFVSEEEFLAREKEGDFVEYAIVHGHYYGTLYAEVVSAVESSLTVLHDVDVQGMENLRAHSDPRIRQALRVIPIIPNDIKELEKYLGERATKDGTSSQDLELRLQNAVRECEILKAMENVVVNDYTPAAIITFNMTLRNILRA
jgi:guanylate kinase